MLSAPHAYLPQAHQRALRRVLQPVPQLHLHRPLLLRPRCVPQHKHKLPPALRRPEAPRQPLHPHRPCPAQGVVDVPHLGVVLPRVLGPVRHKPLHSAPAHADLHPRPARLQLERRLPPHLPPAPHKHHRALAALLCRYLQRPVLPLPCPCVCCVCGCFNPLGSFLLFFFCHLSSFLFFLLFFCFLKNSSSLSLSLLSLLLW